MLMRLPGWPSHFHSRAYSRCANSCRNGSTSNHVHMNGTNFMVLSPAFITQMSLRLSSAQLAMQQECQISLHELDAHLLA